jgi:hypothetical protein
MQYIESQYTDDSSSDLLNSRELMKPCGNAVEIDGG